MFKRSTAFISGLVLTLCIISTAPVKATSSIEIKRLWGVDRYATCSEIVKEGWASSDYAVIVNGENFPDALSASALAKKYNAPILLTQSNSLDKNALNHLKRLKVKSVFIVGGNSVINKSIENYIKNNLGIQTKRYNGIDRNETSTKVAEQIGTDNGIIIALDSEFADALSAAPIAGKLNIPIILVPKDYIPSSVKNFISDKNIPKTYVLGDTDIISDNVASQFPNTQRIIGKDKYERNINIIKTFEDKLDLNSGCLAYSGAFADALSGSAFAALSGNPVILVGDTPTQVTSDFIKSNHFNKLNVLGGVAGIKDETLTNLTSSQNDDNNKVVFKDKNFEQAIRIRINKLSGDLYKDDIKDVTTLIFGIPDPGKTVVQMTDISGIENFVNLQDLNLDFSKVSDISCLKNLTKLKWLRLSGNQVSDISSLKGLTNLYEIELSNNKISDIGALKNFTNLQRLGLGGNKIADISTINSLTNLKYLELDNNQISDISALKELTGLNSLYINNNQIKDISPLTNLRNLESLDLSNNQISDITELKKLINITSLNLKGNPISDKDKESLKKALPNCTITFE
ncbi:cell wall-binding repeat-containing protein [Clostridium sp. JS66]|uniref:cell wall-binding repeat-containing protein n=1 Tax=Clostridium sp. JS66 TaxID=3064705 RepID=UPI00298E3F4D|nr:cell wall-binding repeat-containing protein [Clostridium sp. JS66]WPC43921.1 cell wall-binding repeat-containing protein [Clostridium sp. JS66]